MKKTCCVCGYENTADASTCVSCDTELDEYNDAAWEKVCTCPVCGHVNASNSCRCAKCGKPYTTAWRGGGYEDE